MRRTPTLCNCSQRANPDLVHFRIGNFLTSSVIIVSPVSRNRLRPHRMRSVRYTLWKRISFYSRITESSIPTAKASRTELAEKVTVQNKNLEEGSLDAGIGDDPDVVFEITENRNPAPASSPLLVTKIKLEIGSKTLSSFLLVSEPSGLSVQSRSREANFCKPSIPTRIRH
jgi:hypothetical protein